MWYLMEFWKVSFFFAVSEFKNFFYDQKFNFVYIYDSFILWDFFSLSVANFFLLLLFGHNYDAEIVCLSVCVSFSVFFCNFSISVSIYIEKKWPIIHVLARVCVWCVSKRLAIIYGRLYTHTHTHPAYCTISLFLSPWALLLYNHKQFTFIFFLEFSIFFLFCRFLFKDIDSR